MVAKPKHPVHSPRDGAPTSIPIANVKIGQRLRALDQEAMKVLAASMAVIGLKVPITVRRTAEGYELIAGWHRLEAARQLGWLEISAVIVVGSDADARKWEIAENLHRAELTPLERANHVAEWIRLTEAEVSAQVAPKPQGGRPESGTRAAARELGIERTEAQRSIKIASITPQAKEAAREAGIDNNQSKLLAVAAQAPEQQVGKVIELAKRRTRRAPEEIAAAKREQAQRQAAKQASLDSERREQADRDAAVTSMAILVLELPEPSVRSFGEKAEATPLARISQLVSAMRALRPEQFEGDHDEAL
jgi:ParB-like chromosome segregation protein Spo0J